MGEIARFGVGCLHFGIATESQFSLTESEYLDRLRNALTSTPGVEEFVSETLPDFRNERLVIPSGNPPIYRRRGVLPEIRRFGFAFRVRLSAHERRELMPEMPGDEDVVYGVRVLPNTLGFPIAFTRVVGLKEQDGAVFAAQEALVRHLRRHLTAGSEHGIRLEWIPTTPLHVECWLRAAETEDGDQVFRFRWDYKKRRGQHQVYAEYDPRTFGAIEEAYSDLIWDARQELGLVYDLRQSWLVDGLDWDIVMQDARQLMRTLESGGVRSRLRRFFLASGHTDRVASRATSFQVQLLENAERHRAVDLYLASTYPTGCLFRAVIVEMSELVPTYPVDEILRLVQFAEAKRQHAVATLAALLAGAIGGVAGYYLSVLTS